MSLAFGVMGNGFRLGRVAGIPITVNWTWVPIAVLLSVLFAAGAPGGLLGGVVLTVLLFASILLHELGHALTARAFGIRTQAITLHLLGGVAKIEGEPRRPRDELFIAAAGPAVSFALAVAFGVASFLPLTAGIFAQAAMINFVLAVFNLLPGLPLDGGRILRAVLWASSGDRGRATWKAARVGEVIGWGLIGWGVLGTLGILPGGWLLTALLGWFILSAAGQERRRARLAAAGPSAGPIDLADLLARMQRRADRSATPPRDEEYVVRFPDGREVHGRRPRG